MEYPKYQATGKTAMQQAHLLFHNGVFAFEIYENDKLILGIDQYTKTFWGDELKNTYSKQYSKYHSAMWDIFHKRFNRVHGEYKGWTEHDGHFKLFSLYNYYPKSYTKETVSPESRQIRNLIWDFKYDESKGKTLEDHKRGLDFFVPKVENVLRRTYGENLKDIVFLCVPASSTKKYRMRDVDFSEIVCRETGMMSAMPHIMYLSQGTAKHNGGGVRPKMEYEQDFFSGKSVVVFDDVITNGDTMRKCIDDVIMAGGRVLGAICLGRTCYDTKLPNPYDEYMKIA